MLYNWMLVHTGVLQTQTRNKEQEDKAYRCASTTRQMSQAYGHSKHQLTYTKEGKAYGQHHAYS